MRAALLVAMQALHWGPLQMRAAHSKCPWTSAGETCAACRSIVARACCCCRGMRGERGVAEGIGARVYGGLIDRLSTLCRFGAGTTNPS